jgi:nitrate/nitrite transporter NarK
MNAMLPVAWAICLDIGRKHSGTVSGTMNMAGQAGAFASSVAFGYMVAYFGNYNQPLLPLAGMLLISAVLFAGIDPTQPLIAESA